MCEIFKRSSFLYRLAKSSYTQSKNPCQSTTTRCHFIHKTISTIPDTARSVCVCSKCVTLHRVAHKTLTCMYIIVVRKLYMCAIADHLRLQWSSKRLWDVILLTKSTALRAWENRYLNELDDTKLSWW